MSKSDYFHGNNTQCYLRGSPCHPLQLPLKNLHKSPLSRGLESVQRTDYSRLKPLLFCSLSLSASISLRFEAVEAAAAAAALLPHSP